MSSSYVWHVMSCHVMSYHVTSCHVISRLVMSCHIMSSHVLSCHVTSCHVMSCHLTSVMSCHLTSSHVCHVLSCLVLSCLVMSCHVMSCHVTSCHVLSCHVMSCHVMSCHVMSRLVMSCHVMSSCSRILLTNLSCESSKFFYYGGGVAPTRFSKPWPCAGIRLGATLSLWRRAHCERVRGPRAHFFDLRIVLRGRLRGSGVPRACRGRAGGRAGGCVAALCRGDWVPGAFFPRVANVRFAWQAAGIVRAGSMSGACPRAVSAALCHGDWVPGRVARAQAFTRCNLRFAWQVWDFGCIDVLGKALDGGSAWQAQ